MTEQYVNDAATVLDSGIDDTQTTLDVASAADFPTEGNFRIRIGDELLLVTGVSSTTFTVERGIEGTTPASHGGGENVTHVLTAESLRRIILENGSLYPPDFGDFAWVNQGSATISGDVINTPGSTGDSVRLLTQAAPATPYTITASFEALLIDSGVPSFGLCWRDSATGRMSTLLFRLDGGLPSIQAGHWVNENVFSSSIAWAKITPRDVWWLRLEDDGSNHKMSISQNGETWLEVYSASRTAWLASPDQVAVFTNNYYGTVPSQVKFLSWRVE